MLFGNQEITRENMPSFNWKDADPNYMYSSFQDIFKSYQMNPAVQPSIATQESGNTAWENN